MTDPQQSASHSFAAVSLRGKYPRQFWLMFWGMMISTIGASMVWPFLIIYVTEHLGLPLTAATSLTTLNAIMQTSSAFLAGPVIDRAGRKWVMVVSLAGLGSVYLLYTQASSYAFTALLMALTGLFNPLYRVGGDAMAADLIPPEGRADAYALLRMANNAGIAIGPAIGGFTAAISYNFAFLGAAIGLSTYAVLLALFARETLPGRTAGAAHSPPPADRQAGAPQPAQSSRFDPPADRQAGRSRPGNALGGYARILADRPFMVFVFAFVLNQVCATLVWVLLGAHAKHNFGIPENEYGFIPVTNALIVVLFQAFVTRRTRLHLPLAVLALGSLLYGLACLVIAGSSTFWGFWLGMVIISTGELMLMPTATTYTANLAPPDMRGRYMSIFGLTWGIAAMIGPLLGGILNDQAGITAPWLMGGVSGLCSALWFTWLARRRKN